jgi:hypothetical protein
MGEKYRKGERGREGRGEERHGERGVGTYRRSYTRG